VVFAQRCATVITDAAPPVVSGAALAIFASPVLAQGFDGYVSQPGDHGQIDDGDSSVLHGCHLLLT
jgi:hypothetical protein